jgi:NAD(P)H-dependent FMN reductase
MKVQIIVGSTREGRVGLIAANWVKKEAEKLADTQVELVDLVDYPMPFFDEAISPQYNPDRQPIPAVKKWLDKVAEADAYVLVTPEYNRATSGVLKNALDFLDFQFAKKPTAIVAYGSSGGGQAAANLRDILAGVKSFSTPTVTYFTGRVGEEIDESGQLVDESIRESEYGPQGALKRTLEELKWYSDALAAGRAKE